MLSTLIGWVLCAVGALAVLGFGFFILLVLSWYYEEIDNDIVPYDAPGIEKFIIIAIGGHGKPQAVQRIWKRRWYHKLFYLFVILLFLPIVVIDKIVSFIRKIKWLSR